MSRLRCFSGNVARRLDCVGVLMQLNGNRAVRFRHPKVEAEHMGALPASPRMSATSARLQQRQSGGAGKAVAGAAISTSGHSHAKQR
jgi:hypothetical protein